MDEAHPQGGHFGVLRPGGYKVGKKGFFCVKLKIITSVGKVNIKYNIESFFLMFLNRIA